MPRADATTKGIFEFALTKLQQERHSIEEKILEVEKYLYGKAMSILDTTPTEAPTKMTRKTGKKRVMTPEGKARLIAALKKRWAKVHAAKDAKPVKKATAKRATKKATKKAVKKAAKRPAKDSHTR